MKRSVRRCAGLTAAVALVVGGCGPQAGTNEPIPIGDKAGGEPAPIVLKLALEEDQPLPAAEFARHFAAEVARISGNLVTVDITYRAEGLGVTSWDQKVALLVQGGGFDLGMIPARAFDELGVTSLRALQAPFLLVDDDAVDDVAASEIRTDLMSGLPAVGFEGLALWPDNLRHPLSFGAPILTLADFEGLKVRAPLSRASYELLRALGSNPVDVAEYDSTIDAFEWGFGLNSPKPGVVTGNITFFPKVQALVANGQSFARLTAEQQRFVSEAATATTQWVIENRIREDMAAAAHCNIGGIALAEATDLAEIVAAGAPVYADLESDPVTKRLIAEIRGVVGTRTEPTFVPATCGTIGSSGPSPSIAAASSDPAILNGVYRAHISEAFMLAHGVDGESAFFNAGISTLTFSDGQFGHHLDRDDTTCAGTYKVTNSRVTVSCGGADGREHDPLFSATWTLGDGELRFTDIVPQDPLLPTLFGGKPFVRIADAP